MTRRSKPDISRLKPRLPLSASLVNPVWATTHSFKGERSPFFHASAADRDRVIEAWHQSLTAAFARTEGLQPFEVKCG